MQFVHFHLLSTFLYAKCACHLHFVVPFCLMSSVLTSLYWPRHVCFAYFEALIQLGVYVMWRSHVTFVGLESHLFN